MEDDLFDFFLQTERNPLHPRHHNLPKIVAFAITDGKHKLVQKMLALGSAERKTSCACEMQGHVQSLITDSFGGEVLQQLLHEAIQIVDRNGGAATHPTALQLNERAFVQKVLEIFRECLLGLDGPTLVSIITDRHGNHVIQEWIKLLKLSPQESLTVDQLCRAISSSVVDLSRDEQCCRVVQRLVEIPNCPVLVDTLLEDSALAKLATSQFGNYVIQHILAQAWVRSQDKLKVLRCIQDNFEAFAARQEPLYAMDKYACHLVQTCLSTAQYDKFPIWQQVQKSILELVLDRNKELTQPFRCLAGRKMLTQMRFRLAELRTRQSTKQQYQ